MTLYMLIIMVSDFWTPLYIYYTSFQCPSHMKKLEDWLIWQNIPVIGSKMELMYSLHVFPLDKVFEKLLSEC